MTGKRFNPEKADRLLDPKRKALIDAEWVAELLSLKADDPAADLGAGNGYFTLPLAKRTSNDVYAVDVEPEMLGLLGVRAQEAGYENIGLIESDLEEIPLPDQCITGLVAAFVMHEVPDRVRAFKEMKRLLKTSGKAIVIEWKKEQFEMGPPLSERLESDILIHDIEASGMTVNKVHNLDHVYVIEAK
ncbi:class I SAM-dependent methyltransferase [Alteribacter populi]|uniref:class I SAM-dependent methyltransferase n=1 Tax=Alteribacter populi TaxID=2011011 RepID=UPI000BBB618A|nr:class I SAM-dependent methyltransferase [Alteribacter populi]